MRKLGTKGIYKSLLLAGCAGTIALAVPTMAQDNQAGEVLTTPEEDAAQEGGATIVVTGSRIGRTDFSTPQPTTVLGSEELDNLGIVNAGDALLQIPSNVSTFSPTATGNSNFFAGSILPNLRGLNPFFGSRTLTLVDTRRHVQTNQGDGVDLNFIPSILIDRIETVTGGASAAYGSGAIAGVTNILLDRDLVGAKYELDYGVSQRGDGNDLHAAAAVGLEFAEDRGHFVIGGEYQDAEAIGCYDARTWCARNVGFLSNGVAFGGAPGVPIPYNALIPGMPQNILASDLRDNQVTNGGVFVGSTGFFTPGQVAAVNDAGTGLVPYTLGSPAAFAGPGPGDPQGTVSGGDGVPTNFYSNLRSPVERYVGNAIFTFELTPALEVFAEGSYGKVKTVNVGRGSVVPATGFTRGSIAEDNYYVQQNPALNAALQASLANEPPTLPSFLNGPRAPAGVDYARFGKDWTEQVGQSTTTFDTEVWRVAAGLQGDLNGGFLDGWSWDVYGTFGKTKRIQFLTNLASNYRYRLATDVVDDGAGNPVCRVTRDGVFGGLHPDVAAGYTPVIDELAAGCVPLNVFGTGPVDPAAIEYAFGELREDLTYEQSVFAANASGDLFEGFGAGPIQFALGLEYRHENGQNIAGTGLTAGGQPVTDGQRADFPIQYGESFSGTVDVYEGYAELNLPVVRDTPFFQLLEINAAIRQSRYKNKSTTALSAGATSEHDITTYKISGVWDLNDILRLRGSYSRDARAPNFRELYYRQIIPAGGFFGAITNPNLPNPFPGSQTDNTILDLQGNVAVRPEKADTFTLGAVISGHGWLDGFQFAADYYNIKIKDRITPANLTRTTVGCFTNNDPEFCALIFDVNGVPLTDPAAIDTDVSRVVTQAFNGDGYKTTGIDFTASYLTRLGEDNSLSLRVLASRVIDQIFDDGVNPPYNYVGETGGGGFLEDFQSAPKWQGNATISYMHGPLTLTTQGRYVGQAKVGWDLRDPSDPDYDPTRTLSVFNNTINDYFLFSLNASYRFEDLGFNGHGLELWGSVNNLFDTEPPLFGGGGFTGSAGGTNPIFYDTIGRSFRFGIRGEF